jgi:hypothetical protein
VYGKPEIGGNNVGVIRELRATPPPTLTNKEWDTLHSKLLQHTKDTFFQSLEQFGFLNWPIPRIMFWVLNYWDLTLDQDMIAAIQRIPAEDAAEEEEQNSAVEPADGTDPLDVTRAAG